MDKRTAFVSELVLPRPSLPTAALGTDVCKPPVSCCLWSSSDWGVGGGLCSFVWVFLNLSSITCLHLSRVKHKQKLILVSCAGKWNAGINGELCGAVWSNLSVLSGSYRHQTSSSLYESSITLIRSDRL